MANYPLNRTVYNKDAYEKTIDTSFSQVSTPALPLADTISVTEFFNLYNAIFYDIPTTGDTNSHIYLVAKSGDYINADQVNEDVQLLLDEITLLRQDLLTANQQILNLQISSSIPTSINTPTI
jgi:hypothetical protein